MLPFILEMDPGAQQYACQERNGIRNRGNQTADELDSQWQFEEHRFHHSLYSSDAYENCKSSPYQLQPRFVRAAKHIPAEQTDKCLTECPSQRECSAVQQI